MNKMSCRFRQNSCAKWKGKRPPCFAKYVISGGRLKKNRIYAQISSFCTKEKKVAFKRDFKEIT